MDRAVFGLIGCGGIAQSQHLPNLTRAPHAFLKTVCDLQGERAREMQAKYNVPHCTTSHEKLLADPEIEAVVVATREDAQATMTIEALRAGKHVYVEKPLANTEEECAAVVAAQQASGKHVAVGFNRRFAPAYLKARELLHLDGGPRNMHYRIADEYWRWGKDYPPGVRVIHEVCHIFDALRWLTGSEVTSVYCVQARADDEAITLRFASGCVATIMNCGYGTMDCPKERLEAFSTRGGITVEDFVELRAFGYRGVPARFTFAGHTHPDREFGHKDLLEKGGAEALLMFRRMGWELRDRCERGEESPDKAERERYVQERAPHWNYMVDKGWLHAIEQFAQCVLDGKLPRTATPDDAWRASVLAHATIRSRESGTVVRL
jgi:predicted dehydrogenase